jgi:large subunit ribosomal protein L2
MVGYDFSGLTKKRPEKSLTTFLWSTAWRNNQGRITSRFRGWWHKKLYRLIDFTWYTKPDIAGKVIALEYDPYRTSRIALIQYLDGEKRYVLAWKGALVWNAVMNGPKAPLTAWSRKQLKDIPEWLTVYNLEVTPQTKGKLIKSAGWYATIAWKDELLRLVFIKLPSGEVRKFHEDCRATIGMVSNEDHKNIVIGKAWRQRRLWRKPQNNGINMNPVDHPHGWWEGKVGIWLKYPKAFNGRIVAPGMKTRSAKKWSSKFIVSKRTSN